MIRDPNVREAVATWERWLAQLEEREEFARAFVDTRLRPAIVTYGDMSPVFAVDGSRGLADPDKATVLRIDYELKALVAEKHARNENNLRLRELVRASIEAVLTAISRSRRG